MTTASLTLRTATSADSEALARLAALDSRRLPAGPHLVAESHAGLVAAVSEYDGRAVADPFQRSAEAVDLLGRWREQRRAGRSFARRHGFRRGLRLAGARAL